MNYTCNIEKIMDVDVLVIGGGPAGFGAAVAAGRNGAKTMLVERFGTLGGMSTTGLVGPIMCSFDNDAEEQLSKGVFDELCLRAEAKGGAIHPSKVAPFTPYTSYYRRGHNNVTPFLSHVWARVMDEMATEAGVELLFYTQFVDCIMDGSRIDTVILVNKSGMIGVRPKICIDCSGDADVAVKAGVETWYGDKENNHAAQPTSLFFEVDKIDRDAYIAALEPHFDELDNNFRNCFCWLVDQAKENGEWTIARNELGAYETCVPGRFKINTTRMNHVDGTDAFAVSKAMVEGRRQVEEVLNFIHKYIPGGENAEIVGVAEALGVRETRHIVGRYELSKYDILHRTEFEDSVMSYGYSIDVHAPGDGGGVFQTVDKYYNIPYRSLVPVGCDNLLVAGRCICGASVAAASYRCMSSCMTMGQAAGTAAALNKDTGGTIGDIDIRKLQKTLISQGAVIKGIQV